MDNQDAGFQEFFRSLTGRNPYPYQERLTGSEGNLFLRVPTGLGKTAAAVVGWLWRKTKRPDSTATRLIYCLPTRVLVEQTLDATREWAGKTGVPVYALLGGQVEEDWEIYPERPAILVGTQDLLISRALNRGYATSRYRWPSQFGLFHNDCEWIFDETQLMGAGLGTSAQLAAFRDGFRAYGPCRSIWMSATLGDAEMRTVDFDPTKCSEIKLDGTDEAVESVRMRLGAKKNLTKAPESCRECSGLAKFALQVHREGTQTLVVVNRVDRARDVAAAIRKQDSAPPCELLHSRFRAAERRSWSASLKAKPEGRGRILVATQVIEAGVDLSAAVLITDLAPWASLVQRFGRCNRGGEILPAGEVYWVDRPLAPGKTWDAAKATDEKQREEIAQPYSWSDLEDAEQKLAPLVSASATDLPKAEAPRALHAVPRRRDLLDLFDTSRDLSGHDIDVSRFVRGGDDHDVLIAWRDFEGDDPPPDLARPRTEEQCPAPIGEIKTFLKKRRSLWCWDTVDGSWRKITEGNADGLVRPGIELVARSADGGYDVANGWDPGSSKSVPPFSGAEGAEESAGDDFRSWRKYRQSLEAHCAEVQQAMARILGELRFAGLEDVTEPLLRAALTHDAGKAHPVFQATLGGAAELPLAKSTKGGRHARPHFRHELASAAALLAAGEPDLVAYLVAAHHGQVRLTWRALPGETQPEEEGRLFARGVFDGERLPAIRLGALTLPEMEIRLGPMLLGRAENGDPSWLERCLRLRDEYGPFRLAYLEALLRAADGQASAAPKEVLA